MINFLTLPTERWESAPVRKKLDDLLLIFYRWDPLLPIARFETLAAEIWQPDAESLRQMQLDWESVRELVGTGRRDEVSEGSTRLLGAATKGLGHGSTSRAWSLKQTFVGYIYRSLTSEYPITTTASIDPGATFEREVAPRASSRTSAARWQTSPRSSVAPTRQGRRRSARTVRALIGQHGTGRTGDFERFGIETKIVPVNAAGQLVEAMSFPAFVHEELAFETWEASDLLGAPPTDAHRPDLPREEGVLAEMRLGRPFFWSPSQEEFRGIALEWERYRKSDRAGRARDLPKASETEFIHVRPKGTRLRGPDQAPAGWT